MLEDLRRHWPPEAQILLLKAALADLETARQAWRQWNAGPDLADASWAEVCLLAAIARRIAELAPGVPPDPRLVGARRHIWTRTQMAFAAARPLLATLHAEGLRLMLIKGAARLASDPTLARDRAVRDIDVLIHPDDWARGVSIAKREGWTSVTRDVTATSLRGLHSIGLHSPNPGAKGEFDVHRYVLRECMNEGQDLGLWARALPVRFLDVDVMRLAPTDFALVTLSQSLQYSQASTTHWALDIDPLIRGGAIDWDLLLEEVRKRRIEAYVAAPLLMLQEQMGTPVPSNVLAALTERMSKFALVEFAARATGYGPRTPEQFEARRIMNSGRALRIAREQPNRGPDRSGKESEVRPLAVRHPRLKPTEKIAIRVPTGGTPFTRLRLYLSFDVYRARRHAYLTVQAGAGLGLKMIPIERASKRRGGRVHRQVVILCPACLFALRDVDQVSVSTNGRLEIRNLVLSWGRPKAQVSLGAVAATLRRWRDGLRRAQA